GEIVNVQATKVMRSGSALSFSGFHFDAGCPDDVVARHGHPDIVDAIVRKELGSGVELVGIPTSVFQHAQLGKPLPEEVVVADITGSRKRPRDPGAPFEVDDDRLARLYRLREWHRGHSPVVRVPIVWGDVMKAVGQRVDAVSGDAEGPDVGPSP